MLLLPDHGCDGILRTKRDSEMFTMPNGAIAYSLKVSTMLFHRYVDDLKPSDFEHQPSPGVNCAAWIIGHLTLTDRRSVVGLGVTELPSLPAEFEAKFATTKASANTQSGFGDPIELVKLFDAHRAKLIATVLVADLTKLQEPPVVPSPLFNSRGEAALFMGLHTAMHLGQITIIRRSLGYPPIL